MNELTPERSEIFAAILRQIERAYPCLITAREIADNLKGIEYPSPFEFIGAKGHIKISTSTIREAVHWYRIQASPVPIISSGEGYTIASQPEDLDETIEQLRGRALSILTAYSHLKRRRRAWAEERDHRTAPLELFDIGVT